MSNYSRDITVLLNMRKYCRYVTENIGKLTNGLEEFVKKINSEIPWNQIRGMRNRFAHGYGKMDFEKIYNTAIIDIPLLHKFLDVQIDKFQKKYLNENNN